jgi:hypothetical protein
MAENDRTRGYRDSETHRRPRPQSPESSADPLAELARLIGQQNESAPSYRQNGMPLGYGQPNADQAWSGRDHFAQPDGSGHPAGASQWPSSYGDDPAASAYGNGQYDPRYASGAPQAGHHEYESYPTSYGDPREAGAAYGNGQYSEPHYGDQQYAADPRYDDPRYGDPRYADQHYADQRYADGGAQGYADPRYSEPGFPAQRYGAQSYAAPADGYPHAAASQGYSAYGYQDGGQVHGQIHGQDQGYGNSYYGAPPLPGAMAADERVPAKRRGSIVTVLAVLALAVVGTAAAFGYRAMFGGTGTPVPAPVIKADPRPSKIVPAADASNKPIQDRIGVKTEKIVPRQEEPVQQAAPGQPRVIAPFLAGQNPQAFPPASANIAPAAGAQPSNAEPKRIRTVPIKPEGAEAPGPRSSRSAAPAAQPDDSNVADSSAAPMALTPTGSLPASRQTPARQAHAAIPPASATPGGSPFPTPIPSSAGNAVASGPYAVQVTSQRSEADAQASFRSLQQQFPSVLGSRQPVIRRADLGERGTYYRAQIPFASQSEANDFCSSLKAAGGQCVIARN